MKRTIPGMGHRVLVVEDDSETRSLLAAGLSENFEVAAAGNGREAIEKFEHARYDSIVLDLMMPVLDGFGVLHYLESRRPEMLERVIVVTGASDQMTALLPTGKLAAVLIKPCGISELSAIVSDCCER